MFFDVFCFCFDLYYIFFLTFVCLFFIIFMFCLLKVFIQKEGVRLKVFFYGFFGFAMTKVFQDPFIVVFSRFFCG